MRRWAGLLVLALVVGGTEEVASAAKKKIVVLEFKGPKAARVQKAVVKILKPSATIVTAKTFAKAARKVKGYDGDAEGMSKVARKLHAHGILTGKVAKKGKKYKLTLQVREGTSGEYVGEPISVTLKGARLAGAADRKVKRELKAVLRDLADPSGDDEEDDSGDEVAAEDGDEPADEGGGESVDEGSEGGDDEATDEGGEDEESAFAARTKKGKQGKKRKRARKVASSDAADEEEEDGDEGDGDEDGSVSGGIALSSTEQADMDARGRAVDLVAGVSFVSRKLSFTYPDGLADQPQGYSGAMVPGVYLAGEVYPIALVDRQQRGFLRHIGLSLVFDKVLLIKSKLEGAEEDLATTQTRWGAGLVYRWNFGKTPTSPTLKVSARYNELSFAIDESGAPAGAVEIPDVAYTYIDPGLGFRYPLGDKLAALLDARYLLVTASGQIQDANQYGESSVQGLDVDLGAELKLTSSLLVRGGARYMTYGLSFDGSGALTERNGDTMQDVESATDRYLGFYLVGGFLF